MSRAPFPAGARAVLWYLSGFALFLCSCPHNPRPATPDTRAPELMSLTASAGSLDVTDAEQVVTISARVVDDIAGAERPEVCLQGPNGARKNGGSWWGCTYMARVSGTTLDGVYEASFTFARNDPPGRWTPDVRPLRDSAGNEGSDDVESAFPTSIVLLNKDVAPPRVDTISIVPDAVCGPTTVAVTAHISDDYSGVSLPIWAESYTTVPQPFDVPYRINGPRCRFTLIQGTNVDGMYECHLAVGREWRPGQWFVEVEDPSDAAGRRPPLASTRASTGLTINWDTSAPDVFGVSFSPSPVILTGGDQSVELTARIVDDCAGVANVRVRLVSDRTAMIAGGASMTLIKGNDMDGLWRSEIDLASYTAPGSWTVRWDVADALGNRAVFRGGVLDVESGK